MEYTSQYGQDKYIIENVFNHMTHGCFIDIGAHNGISFSNTYVLEKKYNWEGICVEPHPNIFKELQINRMCTVSDQVVSDKNENLDFYYINDEDNLECGQCSMFSSVFQFKHPNANVSMCKKIASSLYSLLEFHNVPKMIHYMSIDVEGMEFQILNKYFHDEYINNDIGWRRRIVSISVEHNYDEKKQRELDTLFSKFHYTKIKDMGVDSIYIHEIYKDIVI